MMTAEKAVNSEEVYDEQTAMIMRRALGTQGSFVDVGCHEGKFLDVALRMAPAARHLAFEPLPSYAARLKERYAPYRNVEIFPVALSDATGEVSFVHNIDVPSHSGLRERDYPYPDTRRETISVATRRLDDVVGDMPVRMVKVDVEGGELLVLRGAAGLLARQKPIVVFEFGLGAANHYGHGPREIFELFAAHGMRVFTLAGLLNGEAPLTLSALEHEYGAGQYYFAARDAEHGLAAVPEPALEYPRKLNLGCGYDHRAGYLNVDLYERHAPDLVADVRDLSRLPADYFDEIVAHDVLEHLPRADTRPTLAGWARLLRTGGTLSLRSTSYVHLAEWLLDAYGDLERHEVAIHLGYGTQATDGDYHLTSFTPLILQHYLTALGLVPQSAKLLDGWMIEVVAQKGATTGIDLHRTIGSRRALVWRLVKQLVRDRLRLHLVHRGS